MRPHASTMTDVPTRGSWYLHAPTPRYYYSFSKMRTHQVGPFGAERTVCDPYCWDPIQTSQESCESACSVYTETSPVSCMYAYAVARTWNCSLTFVLHLDSWTGTQCHLVSADRDQCTLLAERYSGIEYWEGRVWKHGAFQTQESCTGVCLSSPGTDEVHSRPKYRSRMKRSSLTPKHAG